MRHFGVFVWVLFFTLSAWATPSEPSRNYSYHCNLTQASPKSAQGCRIAGVICNSPVEPTHEDHPPSPNPPPVDRCANHTLHAECEGEDFLHIYDAEAFSVGEDFELTGKESSESNSQAREARLTLRGFAGEWGDYESHLDMTSLYGKNPFSYFKGSCTVAGLPGDEGDATGH